ncbi:unnamed protein product [Cutaneotrichosporon oleaginosum]
MITDAEILDMYDTISSYCTTRPGNIPHEVVAHIMTFVRDGDIPACILTNSAFYLAAKPHLYRTVSLDCYLNVYGPRHAMVDMDICTSGTTRPRPFFRRAWMTRFCHTLDVAPHHPSVCACAMDPPSPFSSGATDTSPHIPPLPHLRFLHLPFDVHLSLHRNEVPSPCGVHGLKPVHLVQHDVYWTSRRPATTTVAGVKSYTANLAEHELRTPDYRPLILQPPDMQPGAHLTLVAPRLFATSPLPRQCDVFRTPACLTILNTLSPRARVGWYARSCPDARCAHHLVRKVGRAVAQFALPDAPRIRLVGFEVLCRGRSLAVYRHLAWLTRAHFTVFAEIAAAAARDDEAAAWRAREGPMDAFLLVPASHWDRCDLGRQAASPAQRMLRNASRRTRGRALGDWQDSWW